MTRHRAIASLLVLLLAFPAWAQQKPDEIYVESIEVNVVTVDVFVTGPDGEPVPALTKGDFEIYEAGKPQEITNFSEVRSEVPHSPLPTQLTTPLEPIPEARSRKIIFFVDGETLHPFNRNKVYESLRAFTGQLIRPGDQAMLAQWNEGLRIEVPFTSLISEFERNLIRLSGENTGKAPRILRRKQAEARIHQELEMALDRRSGYSMADAYRGAQSIGNAYAEQLRNEFKAKATAITGLLSTLAGVEGKKAMIYVGEELPIQPGIEIFQYINETFLPYISTGGRDAVVLSNPQAQAPAESLILETIGRAANANGVTIYMLNAAGSKNLGDTPVETTEVRSNDIAFLETMNRMSSFQAVAAKTGGLAFLEHESIGDEFKRIERDFDTYYSLGYRASASAKAGERAIVVKVKKPGLDVRTRKSYYSKSGPEQMVDRVVANLYYDIGTGDLPIRLVTGKPEKSSHGTFKVPLEVRIPSEALTLIPNGDKLSGKFSVFVGVGDGRGGISKIEQKRQAVNVPVKETRALLGKDFTFSLDLMMRKGENILAVAVQDNISNVSGFARSRLDLK